MVEKHGGNLYKISRKYTLDQKELADFSANINPMGIPREFEDTIKESIRDLETYPDYEYSELKDKLAAFYAFSSNMLHIGNGAAEIIDNLVKVLPHNIGIVQPTFSEYERSSVKYGRKVSYYYLDYKNNFEIDIDNIDDWVEEVLIPKNSSVEKKSNKYKAALFICNPNNPTGTIISQDKLIELVKRLEKKQVLLIVDESFMDFMEDANDFEMLNECLSYSNLLVIRSLTKFYAIPGLRLGYCFSGDLSLIEALNNIQVTWSINTLAMKCGQVIPQLKEYRIASLEYIAQEKEWLWMKLQKYKILKLYPSSANYILFYTKEPNLYEELLQEGIVIRNCSDFPGLTPFHYRIAVRSRAENERLINSLKAIFEC